MIRITIRFCLWLLLITYFLISSCTINEFTGVPAIYRPLLEEAFIQAGENATELQNALLDANQKEKEPVAFLIAYMPKRDLQSLTSEFILENVRYAHKARNEICMV
jgi:hypothetical protein